MTHTQYASFQQIILSCGMQPEIGEVQFRTRATFVVVITASVSREVELQSYRRASLSTDGCGLLKQQFVNFSPV
jgi:hypothetical protein